MVRTPRTTGRRPRSFSKSRQEWSENGGAKSSRRRKDERFASLLTNLDDLKTPICPSESAAYAHYEVPKRAWTAVANAAKVCLSSADRCETQRLEEAREWASVSARRLTRASDDDEGATPAGALGADILELQREGPQPSGILQDYRVHHRRGLALDGRPLA